MADTLKALSIPFVFEDKKETITWTSLPIKHTYHPDFVINTPKGHKLIIETKGRFMPEDQLKQLTIKLQHPEVEVRFVFSNSKSWYRKAKTKTYAKWCEEHGFQYCDYKDFQEVIKKWLKK